MCVYVLYCYHELVNKDLFICTGQMPNQQFQSISNKAKCSRLRPKFRLEGQSALEALASLIKQQHISYTCKCEN